MERKGIGKVNINSIPGRNAKAPAKSVRSRGRAQAFPTTSKLATAPYPRGFRPQTIAGCALRRPGPTVSTPPTRLRPLRCAPCGSAWPHAACGLAA
eukprot:359590-Chlamydomonas_euryale.AAC.2